MVDAERGPPDALDIGCGRKKRPGTVGMDRVRLEGVDVVHGLEHLPWPFPDDRFSEVFAIHVLEHIRDLMPVMEEVHRILKPGRRFVVEVPHYRYEGAFRDPTHVRFFTPHTFEYFSPDHGLN